MTNKSYFEKLKDPRWQKKRLEVLNNSNWMCEQCQETAETLHVHHKIYIKGREPWEYDNGQLSCLCATCHEAITKEGDSLDVVASFAPFDGPHGRSAISALVAGFLGMDYADFIKNQSFGDCPSYRAHFRLGANAQASVSDAIKSELQSWVCAIDETPEEGLF